MKVILAEAFGMCFGVRDALQRVAAVDNPCATTIHGELVHNEVVLHQLDERGFAQQSEHDRDDTPDTPDVLITAHGISDRRRAELLAAGKRLIDTTCPLVRRVHSAAQQLERDGYHVLVLGKQGHVEVQGIVEDLTSYHVLDQIRQVAGYPHARLGVVCQTTLPPALADALVRKIRRLNPHGELRFIDTICDPTRQRQRAMETLLTQVQAVVVVGGHNSNNTRQLVALCEQRRVPVRHVATVGDLDWGWLAQFDTIGLTAGTSTLDATVEEVHAALTRFKPISPATTFQPCCKGSI